MAKECLKHVDLTLNTEEEYFGTKKNQNDEPAIENQIRTEEKKEAKTEETDGTKQEINKTVLDVAEIKQDFNVDVAKTFETILDTEITDTTDSESDKADEENISS